MPELLPETNKLITHNFDSADLYVNRELSWLEFNYRVLEEARDEL